MQVQKEQYEAMIGMIKKKQSVWWWLRKKNIGMEIVAAKYIHDIDIPM